MSRSGPLWYLSSKKQAYGKQPLSSGQQTKTGKQPGKPVQNLPTSNSKSYL